MPASSARLEHHSNLLAAKDYTQAATSYQNLGGDFSGVGLAHDANILTTFGGVLQGIAVGAGTPTQDTTAFHDFEFLVYGIQRDVQARCKLELNGS